ncbi:MAG: hypothetical protein QM791_11030 [Ferruginibacter sp.]
MRKLLFVVALLFSFNVFSQKVDLDRYWVKFNYMRLPDAPLPEYHTYSCMVSSSSNIRDIFPEDQLCSMVMIDGWKQLESKAHISINMTFRDVIVVSNTIQKRTEEIKNKDGKVTGKLYYYYPEVQYTWEASANVTDHKGKTIMGNTIYSTRSDTKVWKGKEYDTYELAQEFIYNNKREIKDNIVQGHITETAKSLKQYLNNTYGYQSSWYSDALWILDNKKHPEYDGQQAALAAVKTALATVTAEGTLDEAKEKMKPAIDYFNDLKKRITGDEKADKKLRYSAFYGLAKIYLFLDMPDEAIKEAEGLVQNDFDTKDGKRLKEDAEELKRKLAANHTVTRHMQIDISQFEGPK